MATASAIEPDAVTLAWVAGFFDGEGSVGLYQRPSNGPNAYRLSVRVSQKRPEVLRLLRSMFGGSLRRSPGTPEWEVADRNAATFLTAIRPHLRVKANEVDVALAYHAGVKPGGRGPKGGAEAAAHLKELKRGA